MSNYNENNYGGGGFYTPNDLQGGSGNNNAYPSGGGQYQLNQYNQGNSYSNGNYNNNSYNQGASQQSYNGYNSGYNGGNMNQPYNNPYGNPYGNNGYNNYPKESAGFGIASMVLGIISIVLMCWPYVSIPTSIIGLILGAVGCKKVAGKGMAVAGVVCSLITLGIALIIVATGVSILNNLGIM